MPVIPSGRVPHTIRLVSEVLSSSSSTSQASICGSTLALMDARAIKAPVPASSRPYHRGRPLDDHGGYPGLRGFLRRYGL
ncbi:MAG: hypothetical protein ACLRXC_08650 [[Clostridium] leptum]